MTKSGFLEKAKDLNAQIETYGLDYQNMPSTLLNDSLKDFMGKFLAVMDSDSTVSVLYAKIDSIQYAADTILHCENLDAMKAGLIVAKKSLYFWASKSDGGSGLGEYYVFGNTSQNKAQEACCGWFKRMIFGDVMGAAGAVTQLGIGAVIGGAFVPGTNVAILGGIGMSAAIGSVTGLIASP